MKTMITLISLLASTSAMADGFNCQTAAGDLNVKLINHTHAEAGTRVAAIMVLSNPEIGQGRKTIARFQDVNGVLASRSSRYEAKVDLRFNDSARKGELILGTKLGQLDEVIADIDFSYAAPVEAGEEVEGQLVLVKRDGAKIKRKLVCSRYLKGE